ncbi:MAG: hypothetical protein HGA87_01635 [Desulfobulbaceae bacterium]|nr:hypothetical protein [Desulfobulbaceae bacterium]
MQKLYSEADMCRLFGLSRQTLMEYRLGKKQPHTAKNGDIVVYTYAPRFTDGKHWFRVGRGIVYTKKAVEILQGSKNKQE